MYQDITLDNHQGTMDVNHELNETFPTAFNHILIDQGEYENEYVFLRTLMYS